MSQLWLICFIISAMKGLKLFLLVSFIVWLIPFILRFTTVSLLITNPGHFTAHSYHMAEFDSSLDQLIVHRDLRGAFAAILTNNLKVGLINISGGAIFGVSTFINLLANGLNLANIMTIALGQGVSLRFLVGSLLAPHLIELLGIWLTGAAGFMGANLCIRYVTNERLPDRKDFLTIVYTSLAGLFIIAIAAWLEVYITINNYLK